MYERTQTPHYVFQSSNPNDLYPYLLVCTKALNNASNYTSCVINVLSFQVTIGSGVSVIKVTSETSFERIGGTATGGGTFWGLGRLLTGAKGFDELLEMATHGDFRKVDMLVKGVVHKPWTS